MERDNRESWLNRVAIGMAPLFEMLARPYSRGDRFHQLRCQGKGDRRALGQSLQR